LKIEKVDQLPSKAPFSKRFEEAVGEACDSASARRVAQRFGMAESTVRGLDLRVLERWNAQRKKPALQQMGVDEIFLGKKTKFVTVVSNLETREPLWFGLERKKETLDGFFGTELSARQRLRIESACVDMWEPYSASIREWAPNCSIVYDKFHIMQHANDAIDEVRRAEFFRQGKKRSLMKGKRWLLLSRWVNLSTRKKQELNELFALNRKLLKAYLLKESLERLWMYSYEGAMLRYLNQWLDQLKWQRLEAFQKLSTAAAPASPEDAIDSVVEELTDRYGEPPAQVQNLVAISRLRRIAQKAGLSDVVAMGGNLRVAPAELPDSIQVRLQRLYPGARLFAQAKAISVPLFAGLANPEHTDPELIEWVSGLLAAIFPVPEPEPAKD